MCMREQSSFLFPLAKHAVVVTGLERSHDELRAAIRLARRRIKESRS